MVDELLVLVSQGKQIDEIRFDLSVPPKAVHYVLHSEPIHTLNITMTMEEFKECRRVFKAWWFAVHNIKFPEVS